MKKSDAFLMQARSDQRVFDLLLRCDDVEGCHRMHYLQMFTEKLSKAVILTEAKSAKISHIALSRLPKILARRRFADKLGYENQFDQFKSFLKRIAPLCDEIERSCPAVASPAEDMPNAEYPWSNSSTSGWVAPCSSTFTTVQDINRKAEVRQLIHFLKVLADRFHEIF